MLLNRNDVREYPFACRARNAMQLEKVRSAAVPSVAARAQWEQR